MRVRNWTTFAAIAVCLSISGWADDHGRNNGNNGNGNGNGFESGLVGSVPDKTVGGVGSGGVPWVVGGSDVSISGDGRFRVEVSGLLIANAMGVPATLVGTTGPVTMVAASLVCGGSGGSVMASSDGAPLSAAGNAEIDTTITLPASCMAPVVLVRVFTSSALTGSQAGVFIALSGFNAGAANHNNDNGNNNNDGHDH